MTLGYALLMRRLLVLVVSGLVLLPLGSVTRAATETPTEKARAAYGLSRELMSPYCPGRTLADCPSPNAAALREEIRDRIGAGVPPDVVRADLERRFGSAVQGTPPSALGWTLPALVLAFGAVGLGVALAKLSRRSAEAPADNEPVPPDLEREIEEELRELGS
jgi:cytochrome c-type biogenesis protein CcmH/NrfF